MFAAAKKFAVVGLVASVKAVEKKKKNPDPPV